MGYFVGLTSTGFVGTDELSAVTSFQPCHIFGDQMLIGMGIRVGFYLLYGSAIIAVLFGIDKHFRFWHGAWGILALSLFLSMFLNLADWNLIIIDYAVLIELVLWYPVYFVFTVLLRPALVIEERRLEKSDEEVRERLAHCRQAAVTQRDIARARAYSDVLKAFALYAAAEEADADYEPAQTALTQCVQHYVSHWHDQIEPTEDGARDSSYVSDGGVVTTVYNQDLIDEISAAPTRADVDKLRDLYVAALVHSNHSIAEARASEQAVAQLAADELRIKRRSRSAKHALRHFLLAMSYKDQLTAAIGLLIWSAYMFGTAALNWPLLHYGNKPGGACDDVPTVYFVFAPKKPFADHRFATFLKVWTVGVCIFAVVTTAAGLFLVAVALLHPATLGLVSRSKIRSTRRTAKSEENPAGSDGVHDARAAPGYSPRARGQHAQEILACLHRPAARNVQHRYRSTTTAKTTTTTTAEGMQFTRWNIPWALLLLVLLAVTVACAELTVSRQGPGNDVPLDFARPPLHETSEILAFLVGLYSLVLVLLSVVSAVFYRVRGWFKGGEEGEEGGEEGEGEGGEEGEEGVGVGRVFGNDTMGWRK